MTVKAPGQGAKGNCSRCELTALCTSHFLSRQLGTLVNRQVELLAWSLIACSGDSRVSRWDSNRPQTLCCGGFGESTRLSIALGSCHTE